MSAIAVSNSGVLGEVSTLGVDVLLFGILFTNSNSWVEQCGNLRLGGGGGGTSVRRYNWWWDTVR